MTEYYHVVPWYDSAEWHTIYEKLFSPNATFQSKEIGLKQLLIWKARCPSLPAGVESTLTLLEVCMQDEGNSDTAGNEQVLRLAYSSAIMRFVNHMLDTETAKGSSFYKAAKNAGVPDWIVDMRHNTAHSYNLPSIVLLRDACTISLKWLQTNYWEKYKLTISDYLAGQESVSVSNNDGQIIALINFCISLSICGHSKCNIKNLSKMPDAAMKESIVNDARDLFGDQIDFSNLKNVSISRLINTMNVHAKKLLNGVDATAQVNRALLGEESLFLSKELLDFIGGRHFLKRSKLNRHYVQCFEVLLTFLHTNDLLLGFVLGLIKVTQSEEDSNKCHLCALWVSEILMALGRSQDFLDNIKQLNYEDLESKKMKELRQLYQHWFPSQKAPSLLLDLHKPVPNELMDINFIQPIISMYNPFLTLFIKDMLKLVRPHLPKITSDKICNLAKLISSPESFPAVNCKIYTEDDFIMDEIPIVIESDENVDKSEEGLQDDKVDDGVSDTWKLASNEHNWSTCPIGRLPWQLKPDFLMDVN